MIITNKCLYQYCSNELAYYDGYLLNIFIETSIVQTNKRRHNYYNGYNE